MTRAVTGAHGSMRVYASARVAARSVVTRTARASGRDHAHCGNFFGDSARSCALAGGERAHALSRYPRRETSHMPPTRNGAHSADCDLSAAASLFPASAANELHAGTARGNGSGAVLGAPHARLCRPDGSARNVCAQPEPIRHVQTHFFEQLKEDYDAESEALAEIWKAGAEHQARTSSNASTG